MHEDTLAWPGANKKQGGQTVDLRVYFVQKYMRLQHSLWHQGLDQHLSNVNTGRPTKTVHLVTLP